MIILMEPDMDAALLFYEKLGLRPVFVHENRWAEFQIGDIKLGLCVTQMQSIEKRTGVVFEVEDLKKVYDELNETVEFVQEPVEAIHGVMATIKDPGGNLIDLYQPTPERVQDLINKVKQDVK